MPQRRKRANEDGEPSEKSSKSKKSKQSRDEKKAEKEVDEQLSSEDDADYIDTQRFLAVRRKKSAAKSDEVLAESRQLAEECKHKAESKFIDHSELILSKSKDILESLLSMFAAVEPTLQEESAKSMPHQSLLTAKSNPLYENAVSLLSASRNLFDGYEAISQSISNARHMARGESSSLEDSKTWLEKVLANRSDKVLRETLSISSSHHTHSGGGNLVEVPQAEEDFWQRFAKLPGQDDMTGKKRSESASNWLKGIDKGQKTVLYLSQFHPGVAD